MRPRSETPYTPTAEPFCGEFRRDKSYINWRPRGTSDWLLIYTAGGSGLITTPACQSRTKLGDIILYAPGDFQHYDTDRETGRWHLLWVHFMPRPSWHPWLQLPSGPHGVRGLSLEKNEVRGRFVRAMRRTLAYSRRKLPSARDFAYNALEEALLWAQVGATHQTGRRIDPRVRKAMDYLAANLRHPFRLETLARHCGISVSRLAHLFKEAAGISPQQFFEQHRMDYSRQLLRRTSLGIAEIAAEIGYDDPFYFSNRFRRDAGKSPSQFRREQNPV